MRTTSCVAATAPSSRRTPQPTGRLALAGGQIATRAVIPRTITTLGAISPHHRFWRRPWSPAILAHNRRRIFRARLLPPDQMEKLDHGCAEAQDVAREHPEPSRAVEGRAPRACQCHGEWPAAQGAAAVAQGRPAGSD